MPNPVHKPDDIQTEEIKTRLSNLSHDIRAPLATCQSFLNVLEMYEYKIQPDELETLALDVQDSISKALILIEEQVISFRAFLEGSK